MKVKVKPKVSTYMYLNDSLRYLSSLTKMLTTDMGNN